MNYLDLDTSTLDFTDAARYRKFATVTARKAHPGEHLPTILADGTEETTRTLTGEETVITNPGGEQHAIHPDLFHHLYVHIQGDLYQAAGSIRAIPNPTGKPIRITAPWGQSQYGDADCWIAEGNNPEDRYLIGGRELTETYRPVQLDPSTQGEL